MFRVVMNSSEVENHLRIFWNVVISKGCVASHSMRDANVGKRAMTYDLRDGGLQIWQTASILHAR